MSGPRALRVMLAGLTLVMLGAALAFGEDAARKAPPDPDPGLLEFLGSVDGLAEARPASLDPELRPPGPAPRAGAAPAAARHPAGSRRAPARPAATSHRPRTANPRTPHPSPSAA